MNQSELLEAELQRLAFPPREDERPRNLGTVCFTATCAGNAWEVASNAKDVLRIVSEESLDRWPSLEEWKRKLPRWFVERCAPEMSHLEAENWLARWQSLSFEEQQRAELEKSWSLSDWLYWLKPGIRTWFWWDIAEPSGSKIVLAVEVLDWPFPWGALSWLLRASGATNVEAEE